MAKTDKQEKRIKRIDNDLYVLLAIANEPNISISALKRRIGLSYPVVNKYVKDLRASEYIIYEVSNECDREHDIYGKLGKCKITPVGIEYLMSVQPYTILNFPSDKIKVPLTLSVERAEEAIRVWLHFDKSNELTRLFAKVWVDMWDDKNLAYWERLFPMNRILEYKMAKSMIEQAKKEPMFKKADHSNMEKRIKRIELLGAEIDERYWEIYRTLPPGRSLSDHLKEMIERHERKNAEPIQMERPKKSK